MKLSKVLIYTIVLLGIAGYVYFYEIKHKSQEEELESKKAQLIDIKRETIDYIVLKTKEGKTIELRRPADIWVINSPVQTKADIFAINDLLSSAVEAKHERIISDDKPNLQEYGLEHPDFEIIFSGENQRHVIKFGGKNPSGKSYYAKVDARPEVFLTADTLKNALDKALINLRDKSVAAITPEDVISLAFESKAGRVELKKQEDGRWILTQPEKLPAKTAAVENNIRTLTTLVASEVIDDPQTDNYAYGFDNPEHVIRLSGPKTTQTLEIGKPVDGGQGPGSRVYIRVKEQNKLFEISQSYLRNLKLKFDELRDKSVISFNPPDIQKINIEIDGKSWIFSQSDKKWSIESPEKKELPEPWPVSSLLWSIKDLEWEALEPMPTDLAETGLDKPRAEIRLWKKDGSEFMKLKLGWTDVISKEQAESGAPGRVYAIVEPSVDKNTIMVLPGSFVTKLEDTLTQVTEKRH